MICEKKVYKHGLTAKKVMFRAGFDNTIPVIKNFVVVNVSDRMTVEIGIVVP
jgi:hypothetical protein